MEYKIKIKAFEGPFDLLLHLIKEANIDIYDIKLEEITKQYLDYIQALEELNLTIASEYLVIAAELIEIKSKLLLPQPEIINDLETEIDPRENLIRRLIEYKRYKELTPQFKERAVQRQQLYTKPPTILPKANIIKNKGEVSVSDLWGALVKWQERKQQEQPLVTTVTKKEIALPLVMTKIRNILKQKHQVTFEDLFEERTRPYLVITFLAILEMVKLGEIIIKQNKYLDYIYLEKQGSE